MNEISPKELADDAVLLDVREQNEWDAGHAPNAVHIPLTEVPQRLDELPDAEPLLVICRSGGRSSQAVAWLAHQGFEPVNVAGGMRQWSIDGKPVVVDGGAEGTVV